MTGNVTPSKAFVGATIFDGHKRHENSTLLTNGHIVSKIIPSQDVPPGMQTIKFEGGLLAP
ncbi:MAG: N-acetylglucosamine-6-phosphate deacetylase, partial [Hyphomicrobiales bacterium]